MSHRLRGGGTEGVSNQGAVPSVLRWGTGPGSLSGEGGQRGFREPSGSRLRGEGGRVGLGGSAWLVVEGES